MASANVYFEVRQSAFNARMYTFAIVNERHIDIRGFLADGFYLFDHEIQRVIDEHFIVKLSCCLIVVLEKIVQTDDGEMKEKQTIYIQTRSEIVDLDTDLSEFYRGEIIKYLLSQIDDIFTEGSGFSLSSIEELVIHVNKYEPFRGSSFIELPKYLTSKKAIVNVVNKDEMCFKWAILSALYPAVWNPQRLSHYLQYKDELNFDGIDFPVKINQIDKFENLNPTISVNVYIYEVKGDEKFVRPIRVTKNVKRNHVHLLLMMKQVKSKNPHQDQDVQVQSHYCWIKNLSRLVSNQVSNHNGSHFFCDRCLNFFQKLEGLKKHRNHCMQQNEYAIEMPGADNNIIKFKNWKNQLECPFIVYADVEALLKAPDLQFCKSSSTIAYQQHEVYSIGYYFKCSFDDSKSYYASKRGPDCIDWFVSEMKSAAELVAQHLNNIIPLQMTAIHEQIFQKAQSCHICEKQFDADSVKVRDHSHLTGEFRGAAHQDCNLQYVESRVIPVVFHNLTHYDSHFLLRKLANGFEGDMQIIPINAEKYISFSKSVKGTAQPFMEEIKLRFIDSFRFMASSLDYLSSLIPSEKKKILRSECKSLSEEQLQLLERKGVFCYDYVDSWEKLDDLSLPPMKAFYSTLIDSPISDDDYNFAKKVWQKFNIKNLAEYSDLYLKTDVLLLADVFENFRVTCRDIYKLDPANYYTAPGLSFDAMLRYTKVQLELLTDVDMLMFVERGIRGGISQCSKRYVHANNKYMDDYNENEKSSYLMYLDANNLYGHSMMQHLPHNNFQWSEISFDQEKILNLPDDGEIGYVFEVDLDYPPNLHDLHNEYPFCAENMHVPGTKNVKKLLLTLFDKKNYVIHYRMLKLALQHGLILKKVHRVLQFNQTAWLKPYIMLNTEKRTLATNDFEKNFYKLLCNAIFGK